MGNAPRKLEGEMTFAAFLGFIDARPGERWELIDGEPSSMAGGTLRHDRIALNIAAALLPQVDRRGCTVHKADTMVRSAVSDRFSAVPDVMVRCGPIDDRRREVDDPLVIVEVLSPSTAADDRGRKFLRYTEMPTLAAYLLVEQDEVRIEVWTPRTAPAGSIDRPEAHEAAGRAWERDVVAGLDAGLDIEALAFTMPLSEVYAGTGLAFRA